MTSRAIHDDADRAETTPDSPGFNVFTNLLLGKVRVQVGSFHLRSLGRFEYVTITSLQTYCSLGKVYAAAPGGGEDRPGTDGYLKMAAVCEGGEKVFFDVVAVLLLLLLVAVAGCEAW